MFVKCLENYMGCEANKAYQLDDPLGRAMVELKKAAPINAEDFMTATRAAGDEALKNSILSSVGDQVARALADFKKGAGTDGNPNPRPPGTGADFNTIASGEDPAVKANERMFKRIADDKARGIRSGLGEVSHLFGVLQHPQLARGGPNYVVQANRRLQLLSGSVTSYQFNEATGEHVERTQYEAPDGSIQTVTRTGTDSIGGGGAYGYALKPDFLSSLFEVSIEQQVFVPATTRLPVATGNELRYPAFDQYKAPTVVNGLMQPAVLSGVALYYAGETAPRTLTDAGLNMIDYKITDLTAFTALSRDFVADNYLAFDSQLTRMIGRGFGWMEDWVCINGNGIGRPQGYLNANCAIAVSRTAANEIQPYDLTTMISSASPMVWDDLRWITNVTTIPQLAILRDNNGAYVFQPNALINQAMQLTIMEKSMGGRGAELMHRPMGTLLGFPVYFSEKVSTLGHTGDLSLVAPSQYGLAERSGLEIAVSEHFYFNQDLIAYRFKKRHDGKMLWRAPYIQADTFATPASGTQVSPIVILH
jgi:hypothetical protein